MNKDNKVSKDNKNNKNMGEKNMEQVIPLRRIYVKNFVPYEVYINLAPVGDILHDGKKVGIFSKLNKGIDFFPVKFEIDTTAAKECVDKGCSLVDGALCFSCYISEGKIRELNLLEKDTSLITTEQFGFKTFCLSEEIDRIYPYKKMRVAPKDYKDIKKNGAIYAESAVITRDVIQIGEFDKLEDSGIMCTFSRFGLKLIECSAGKACFVALKEGSLKGNLFQLTSHSLDYMGNLFNIHGNSYDIEKIEGIDYND